MSTAAIDDQEEDRFEKELATIKSLSDLMRYVIGGAVALGIWAGALQLQVSTNAKANDTNADRIRELEIRGASEREKLENILKTVERIDRKLNP